MCHTTPKLMPLSVSLTHKFAKNLNYVRRSGGKTQVIVELLKCMNLKPKYTDK